MAKKVLVTGGAGFIGSNLVNDLLNDNYHVTILDYMMRRGSEQNASWLRKQHPDGKLHLIREDVRNFPAVRAAIEDVDVIYHLAAQVAVTTSVEDPRTDFDINAVGTLNILEAARLCGHRPIIVYTSTNKVYGGMEDVEIVERTSRYMYRDIPNGIPESRPLDFHSPYGCSKGSMDQYVRDYARIYKLPTVVFRMSCIYGPRQFGTEDQGWLAHFMISVAKGLPITIYGDGKQVRDVLFVDDLIRALRLAVQKIDTTAGEVFNIGGGPSNTLSVWHEFGELLIGLSKKRISPRFRDWRPGDQKCYISDIRKANRLLGWNPLVKNEVGVSNLWEWVSSNGPLFRMPVVQPASTPTSTSESK